MVPPAEKQGFGSKKLEELNGLHNSLDGAALDSEKSMASKLQIGAVMHSGDISSQDSVVQAKAAATVVTRPRSSKNTGAGKHFAWLGFGLQNLSESGRKNLDTYSSVSASLGLTTTRQAAFLAAVVQMRKQQWVAEDSRAGTEDLGKKLRSQLAVLRQHIEQLKTLSSATEQQSVARLAEAEEKQYRKVRLDIKAENYVEELSQLDNRLKRESFVTELRHESLTERAAKLAAKQENIAALQQKLRFFRDLPPDIDAARQLYAAKLAQVEAATKDFETGLSQL